MEDAASGWGGCEAPSSKKAITVGGGGGGGGVGGAGEEEPPPPAEVLTEAIAAESTGRLPPLLPLLLLVAPGTKPGAWIGMGSHTSFPLALLLVMLSSSVGNGAAPLPFRAAGASSVIPLPPPMVKGTPPGGSKDGALNGPEGKVKKTACPRPWPPLPPPPPPPSFSPSPPPPPPTPPRGSMWAMSLMEVSPKSIDSSWEDARVGVSCSCCCCCCCWLLMSMVCVLLLKSHRSAAHPTPPRRQDGQLRGPPSEGFPGPLRTFTTRPLAPGWGGV